MCLRMESKSLPHHVVDRIMERLPVKSLLRFKLVSKHWKSTIESRWFQERQFKHRQLSGDPDVLMVSALPLDRPTSDPVSLTTLVLGSKSAVNIPTPWTDTDYSASFSSCDSLVCLYGLRKPGFVVNPTTRYFRPLPLCRLQQLVIDLGAAYSELGHVYADLAFGKDIFTATYKPVWLYNSSEIGLQNATTCEIFDFSTNAWRYLTPSAPYRLSGSPFPVFAEGSLHWFTECQETKIVSLDLHTEAFKVTTKAPFADADPRDIAMCSLDNRLCVSHKVWPNQLIWSFHSATKTWEKTWSIHLDWTCFWYLIPRLYALVPLALLHDAQKKKKKKTLIFFDICDRRKLVTGELESEMYHHAFSAESVGHPVCYFPSLFSI